MSRRDRIGRAVGLDSRIEVRFNSLGDFLGASPKQAGKDWKWLRFR